MLMVLTGGKRELRYVRKAGQRAVITQQFVVHSPPLTFFLASF